MNGNHQSERQLQHERLCAYLFGELDARERVAVEAELANDPALALERGRLEATIALVRDAVPAGDALSGEARDALTAAAARRSAGGTLAPVYPWPVRLARSPLTAAAAVIAVLGVFAGIGMQQEPPARGGEAADATVQTEAIARAKGELSPDDARVRGEVARQARTWPAALDGLAAAGAEETALEEPVPERAPDADADPTALGGGTYRGPSDTVAPSASAPVPVAEGTPFETTEESEDAYFTWRDTAATPFGKSSPPERPGHADSPRASGQEGLDASSEEPLRDLGYVGEPDAAGEPVSSLRVLDLNGFGARREDPRFDPGALRRAGKDHGLFGLQPPPSTRGVPGPGDAGRAYDGRTPSVRGSGTESLGELLAFDAPGALAGGGSRLIDSLGDADGAGPFGAIGADRRHRGIDRYRADDIVRFCRIRPHETPSAMFFRCWGDNPFEYARLDPLSTFAADVDTASYALARNYLAKGYMPTKEQIRTEEFVNSFDSGVPAPAEDVFRIDIEMAPSPFSSRPDAWMLRTVVRGKAIDELERPPLALTFVVDVSGSMRQENRIELVKHALRLLVGQLDANDAIAIVAFSSEARLVLPMTSAANAAVIESAIFGLNPDGSTNAEAGLLMGYAQAAQGLTPGANNRVVMLSDGVANVGNTDVATMLQNVEVHRSKGIYLNTIGVGMGNHNDALLEQLANKGDGICNYVDSAAEATKVLVEGFTGQFTPIARDVKIQVEFDAAQVESYRLLGYENRAIADAQFRDDSVDAGEVGAGHQVTALYEILRAPGATNDGPLATARVRFKPPFAVDSARLDAASRDAAEIAREIERGIEFRQVATSFQGATVGFQRAALVAQLAELLRRSVHARGDSYDRLVSEAIRLEKVAEDPGFTEFTTLLAASRDLIVRHLPPDDEIARAIDELTRHNYLQGKMAQLQAEDRELTAEILQELQNRNAELERRIRELLER